MALAGLGDGFMVAGAGTGSTGGSEVFAAAFAATTDFAAGAAAGLAAAASAGFLAPPADFGAPPLAIGVDPASDFSTGTATFKAATGPGFETAGRFGVEGAGLMTARPAPGSGIAGLVRATPGLAAVGRGGAADFAGIGAAVTAALRGARGADATSTAFSAVPAFAGLPRAGGFMPAHLPAEHRRWHAAPAASAVSQPCF